MLLVLRHKGISSVGRGRVSNSYLPASGGCRSAATAFTPARPSGSSRMLEAALTKHDGRRRAFPCLRPPKPSVALRRSRCTPG